MPAVDIYFPLELVTGQVDFVERSTAAGRDNAGSPVESWAKTYATPVPCTVDWETAPADQAFGQRVMEFAGTAYFPPVSRVGGQYVWNPNGTLPDIRIRDRMAVGKWPNGATRYLMATKAINAYFQGIILVVNFTARAPG